MTFFGCATSNPPAFREPYFTAGVSSGKSLLFFPIVDVELQNKATFHAHYKDDLKKINTDNPEKTIIYRLLCKSLHTYVENIAVRCDETLDLNPEDIHDTILPASVGANWERRDSGAVDTFFVPNQFVLTLENPPDYVLFVARPAFASWLVHPKQEGVTLTGSYVIMDYHMGTVVGYGYLKTSGSYPITSFSGTKVGEQAPESRRYEMPKNLWPHVLDWAAVQIIRDTPFEGEKARRYLKYLKGVW